MKSFSTVLSSLFLFTSLIASTTFAQEGESTTDPTGGSSCLEMVNWNLIIPDSMVFNLQRCQSWTQMHEGIKNYLLQRSGYDFSWYNYEAVSPEGAVALLQADHTDGDGSPALSSEAINAFLNLYTHPNILNYMETISYGENYMGGTGVTNFVAMYSKDLNHVILVEKFVYAE